MHRFSVPHCSSNWGMQAGSLSWVLPSQGLPYFWPRELSCGEQSQAPGGFLLVWWEAASTEPCSGAQHSDRSDNTRVGAQGPQGDTTGKPLSLSSKPGRQVRNSSSAAFGLHESPVQGWFGQELGSTDIKSLVGLMGDESTAATSTTAQACYCWLRFPGKQWHKLRGAVPQPPACPFIMQLRAVRAPCSCCGELEGVYLSIFIIHRYVRDDRAFSTL